MGLFSGKLMSARKARNLADARAMADAAFAAHPDAVRSLPGSDADFGALRAEGIAEREKIEHLHKRGVDAPAVIHSLRPTDVADLSGGRKFEFDVSIQLASGQSHKTQISQHMLPLQVEALSKGRAITVKYDPDEPDNAMLIDW